MAAMPFKELKKLTDKELAAARAYTENSPWWHHAMQGRDGLGCPAFQADINLLSPQLPSLVTAAASYELTEPLVLYSGLGNGYSALGGLWPNEPKHLVGLELTYGGVFSTSSEEDRAMDFMLSGSSFRPVFLTIHGWVGMKGLPTELLGFDKGHEGEVVVAAQTRFRICGGARRMGGKGEYLHLILNDYAAPCP